MNLSITAPLNISRKAVASEVLDIVDGKIIVIANDAKSERMWINTLLEKKERIDKITLYFMLAGAMFSLIEAQECLYLKGIKYIILEDSLFVYTNICVQRWISTIVTNNPGCNFIGISPTANDGYLARIDNRVGHITQITFEGLKSPAGKKEHEEDKKKINLHLFSNDIKDEVGVKGISCYNLKENRTTVVVDPNQFKDKIAESQEKEIRCYCKVKQAIDLLTYANDLVSRLMVFSQNPKDAKAMTLIGQQLLDMFFDNDMNILKCGKISDISDINITDQKSIIFCNRGQSMDTSLSRIVNFFARATFGSSVFDYIKKQFSLNSSSTLLIEDNSMDIDDTLLKGVRNIILLGQSKYSHDFIVDLAEKLDNNCNIVIIYTKDTIDESNVLKAIKGLKDNTLTIIKHDLSS